MDRVEPRHAARRAAASERLGVVTRAMLRLPEPTDTLVMNVAFIFVFLGGATVLTLAIVSRPAGLDVAVNTTVAIAAVVSALAVWPVRHLPLSAPVIHALTALGTGLITVVVAYGGDWAPSFAVFYLWMVLYAAAFFGLGGWLAHLGLAAVGYGVAAALHAAPSTLGQFVPVVAGPALVLGGFTYVVSSRRRDTARRLLDCVAISGQLVNDAPADTDVLEIICAGARGACAATSVVVLVGNEHGDEHGDQQWVPAAGASERPVDIGTPVRVTPPGDQPALTRVTREHTGTGSRLVVRLDHQGARVGLLVVEWDTVLARVSDVMAHLVRAYAEQAAAALAYRSVHTQLSELADTDPLTGLANRRAFGVALESAARDATRTGAPLTVATFDLNHFKAFNDTHGHPAGDDLLVGLATSWSGRLRGRDVLARLGGDEFALLLPTTDTEDALALTAELCRSMTPGIVTCSAGIATWDGSETLDALLEDVDAMLYAAKRAASPLPLARRPENGTQEPRMRATG